MDKIMDIFKNIPLPVLFEKERAEYPDTFSKELNYQCSRIIFIASPVFIDSQLFNILLNQPSYTF